MQTRDESFASRIERVQSNNELIKPVRLTHFRALLGMASSCGDGGSGRKRIAFKVRHVVAPRVTSRRIWTEMEDACRVFRSPGGPSRCASGRALQAYLNLLQRRQIRAQEQVCLCRDWMQSP